MKELVERFVKLESEIAEEKGRFSLFALFLREDVENKWDVVVSATWFSQYQNQRAILEYLVPKIQRQLNPEELLTLSRIVTVDPDNESVKAINRAVSIEHGTVDVQDSDFFGLRIKHAFIITSKDRDLVSSPTGAV